MGRPRKYFTEEERKQAIRPTKTKCMLNKEWGDVLLVTITITH